MECALDHWHDLKNDDGKVTGHVILGRIKRFQTVSAKCADMAEYAERLHLWTRGPHEGLARKAASGVETWWCHVSWTSHYRSLDLPLINSASAEPLRTYHDDFCLLKLRSLYSMCEAPRPYWEQVKDTADVAAALDRESAVVS